MDQSNVEMGQSPPAYQEEDKFNIAFSEQSVRSAFVKKVFMLVSIMLLVTTLMCAIPFIWPSVATWISDVVWPLYVACGIFIATAITLSCFVSIRRNYPLNLILLAVFTLSSGFMTMTVCSFYTVSSVLMCLIITTAVSVSIVIFAMFIKKDLTSMIGIVFVISLCLLFFGIVAAIAIAACGVTWLYTLYAALSAILMMVWLAIDVQLIMGRGRYSISPEDYVFAAMQIFLDVINIFLYLLQIFGKFK